MIKMPTKKIHPLRERVKKYRMKLWQIQELVDPRFSIPQISRFLDGTIPMHPEFEKNLRAVLDQIEKEANG